MSLTKIETCCAWPSATSDTCRPCWASARTACSAGAGSAVSRRPSGLCGCALTAARGGAEARLLPGSAAGAAASCGSPPVRPEALAAPERLGSRNGPRHGTLADTPYCPGMQSPRSSLKEEPLMRPLDAASSLLCNADTPRAPEPAHAWTSPASLELAAVCTRRAQALATSLGVVPRLRLETEGAVALVSRESHAFRSRVTLILIRDGESEAEG